MLVEIGLGGGKFLDPRGNSLLGGLRLVERAQRLPFGLDRACEFPFKCDQSSLKRGELLASGELIALGQFRSAAQVGQYLSKF